MVGQPAGRGGVVLCAICLVFAMATLGAQTVRDVHGTVSDQTGAVLVDASVVLDDGKGHRYITRTDNRGRYQIEAIEPGAYTLTVVGEGFSDFSQSIDLTAGRSRLFDVKLKLEFKEQVEVTIPSLPDLTSLRISGKALEKLPEEPRKLLRSLQRLAGLDANPGELQIYVNGAPGRLPPKAMIDMITINLDPFAAQFAEPGQTRVEVVTKPAADRFSSVGSFNFNNQALNARDAFAPVRAPILERGLELNFGGPIVKDRWGFSLSVGRPEERGSSTIHATTLNPATLKPELLQSAVANSSRGANVALHTSFRAAQTNTVNISYSHSTENTSNQGLDSGLDLPERAFNSSSRNDGVHATMTSVLGGTFLSETQFAVGRHRSDRFALSSRPALFVFNAFQTGGNQDALFNQTADSLQIGNVITYTRTQHTWRAGVGVNRSSLTNADRTGFGGTFTFGTDFERDAAGAVVRDVNGQATVISPLELYRRTLLALPGYGPSQFSIVAGDPAVQLAQFEGVWFVQDDWRASSRFSLSYGLRHQFQTNLGSHMDLAPRVGMAWRLTEKRGRTLRIGAGLFHARVAPEITLDALRLDGRRQQALVIERPPFFPVVPDTFSDATIVQPTIHVKAPDLQAPRSFGSRVTYQQRLVGPLHGSIRYAFERGADLLRTRIINASDLSAQRPFAAGGPIWQVESTGRSIRHELRLAFNADVSDNLSFYGSYTRASARSDTDQAGTLPADSSDPAAEFGRSRSDRRDRFHFEWTMTLPHGVEVSPNISINSGPPFNITTGADNNRDTVFSDRPAFASPDSVDAIVTPFGIFNPTPRPGDVIIPRNFGQAAGELTVNLDVSKTFGFGPRRSDGHRPYHLSFNAEGSNLTNRTNLAGFNGVVTSPDFGRATSARDARKIKLSMDVSF